MVNGVQAGITVSNGRYEGGLKIGQTGLWEFSEKVVVATFWNVCFAQQSCLYSRIRYMLIN